MDAEERRADREMWIYPCAWGHCGEGEWADAGGR